MKKYKGVIIAFALIISPIFVSGVFAQSQVIQKLGMQAIKYYDFIAQIETQNSGNVFIYKVQDGKTDCYVMGKSDTKYGEDWGISCVKVR